MSRETDEAAYGQAMNDSLNQLSGMNYANLSNQICGRTQSCTANVPAKKSIRLGILSVVAKMLRLTIHVEGRPYGFKSFGAGSAAIPSQGLCCSKPNRG